MIKPTMTITQTNVIQTTMNIGKVVERMKDQTIGKNRKLKPKLIIKSPTSLKTNSCVTSESPSKDLNLDDSATSISPKNCSIYSIPSSPLS